MHDEDALDRILAAYRKTKGIRFGQFIALSCFPWSVYFLSDISLAAACERYAAKRHGRVGPGNEGGQP